MIDVERLRLAFKEGFEMSVSNDLRPRVMAAVAARGGGPSRPRLALRFVAGAAVAVVVIAGAVVALRLHPLLGAAPAGALPPSAAQLNAVANLVYTRDSQGYIAACDAGGSQAACPFTPRLADQLTKLQSSACIACKTGSTTLTFSPLPATGGGTVRALLFNGHLEFDLKLITVAGQLGVDDIVMACPGGPGISVYRMTRYSGPGYAPYVGPTASCVGVP